MMLLLSIIFSYFLASIFADPLITIRQGQLNGTVLKSRDGRSFFAFYGIPYAKPPIRNLRFAPPQKAPSWQGVRDATKKASVCMQPESFINPETNFTGSEDCLYLSVFTPEINSSKLLPVMVYIYGGAYFTGGGDDKGPHFFMDKPMVVVTMNYRHGIFGFLSSSDTRIPGNFGLKDQVAALKWVRSNIKNFGGDPNTVTLLGQSSGSTCVHLHTMSSLSKGLFHRAIMQSGSALSFWSHYDGRHAKRAFNDLLERINPNCTQNNTSQVLRCLRKLPDVELLRAEQSFRTEKPIVMKFRPVIEKSRVKNAFLTSSPHRPDYQNISMPWIMGFNSAEGMFNAITLLHEVQSQNKTLNKEVTADMPLFLHYKYFVKKENKTKYGAALKNFYFKNGKANETDQQQLCNLFGDMIFGMPALHAAYKYPGPKYFYYYDLKTNSNATEMAKALFHSSKTFDITGSSHGDEMRSLFSVNRASKPLSAAEKQLALQFLTYWTNFIITGNPNSADLPVWNILQPDTGDYLHITNNGFAMGKDLLRDRYNQWKKINNILI